MRRLGAWGHYIRDGESNVLRMWEIAMEGYILLNSGGLWVPKNNSVEIFIEM